VAKCMQANYRFSWPCRSRASEACEQANLVLYQYHIPMSLIRAARAIGVRACSVAPIQTQMLPASRGFASFDERERGEDNSLITPAHCMSACNEHATQKHCSPAINAMPPQSCPDPPTQRTCVCAQLVHFKREDERLLRQLLQKVQTGHHRAATRHAIRAQHAQVRGWHVPDRKQCTCR